MGGGSPEDQRSGVSRELIIRPEAEAEIDEAYDWYEARSRGLGANFLLYVEAVLREVRRTIRPHEMLAKHFELSSRDTPRPRRHRGSDHPEPPGEGALKHRGDLRPVASEASVGLVARREQAKIQTARFLAIEGDVDAEVLGFAYVTLCLTAQDDPGSSQER